MVFKLFITQNKEFNILILTQRLLIAIIDIILKILIIILVV